MKNLFGRFILALSFLGLVCLAFNPSWVVEIKKRISQAPKPAIISDTPETKDEPKDIARTNSSDHNLDEVLDITPPATPSDIPSPTLKTPDMKTRPENPSNNPAPASRPKIDIISPEPADTRPPKVIKTSTLPKTNTPNNNNLPRLPGYESIAKNDDWIGVAPCGLDIFDPPLTLPGVTLYDANAVFTDSLNTQYGQTITNQPAYLFKSPSGATLQLVKPVVKYYSLSGTSFRETQRNLMDNKPLEMPGDGLSNQNNSGDSRETTTLANIYAPTSLEYIMSGFGTQYDLVLDQLILTTGYLVTLPQWPNYGAASKVDQEKWDDLFCSAAHHELGHLRIRLDILAETLDGFASIPRGKSKADIQRLTEAYRLEISDSVDNRQDAYHIYNGGGIRKGMTELPYAELPFPWLENKRD